MKALLVLAVATGCGRVGFDSDGLCSTSTAGIQRTSATTIPTATAPFDATVKQVQGELIVLGMHTLWNPGLVAPRVTDTFGEHWNAVPPQAACDAISIRFFYTFATRSGQNTLTLDGSQGDGQATVGAFVATYSGVATTATIAATQGRQNSNTPGMATNVLDSGALVTESPATIVALVDAGYGTQVLAPQDGFGLVAREESSASAMFDMSVAPGSYTARAAMPATSNCWMASALALRAP